MQAHVSTDVFPTEVHKGVAQMSVCPQSGEKRIGGWKALSDNCSANCNYTTNTNTPDIDQAEQEFLRKQKQIPKNEKQ